jgi:hypothetical protein
VPLDRHATMTNDVDRSVGMASLRVVEAEVLLRAATALRLDGFLTEAEYQAKRRRLAAQR